MVNKAIYKEKSRFSMPKAGWAGLAACAGVVAACALLAWKAIRRRSA